MHNNKKLSLTPQAIGSIMLAVQKGLLAASQDKPPEECDITKLLLDFQLTNTKDGLIVLNPPTIEMDKKETE